MFAFYFGKNIISNLWLSCVLRFILAGITIQFIQGCNRNGVLIIILLRYILLGWFLPTKWIFDCSTPVLLFLSTLDNPWLMCNTSARCCRREWVPIIGLMNIWSNARMQAHILQRNLIEKSILFNPFVHT